MAIKEKQAENIKKIIETLFKYGNKRHLSEIIPSDSNKERCIFYNKSTGSVSFVNIIDKYIESHIYTTSFDFKSFKSFNESNTFFYYNTLIEGNERLINFITIDEKRELELCEKKVIDFSLKSKLTNKEILDNFSINEISYLLRNQELFNHNVEDFIEFLNC